MTLSIEDGAMIALIRTLGFVGNSHYCGGCLNEFHADRGQHKAGCPTLADLIADEEWFENVRLYLGTDA